VIVAVTGANGLVGRRVVTILSGHGHQVVALGRGEARWTLPSGASWRGVDLSDSAGLFRVLDDAKPALVLNPGGMTDVDGCERDRDGAWGANVEGPAALARWTKRAGSFLVHVSTDYVFDGDAGPYDVTATPNPRGFYAITKHAGEQAVKTLAADGAWAIARTAVVYGWPSTGKNNFGTWLVTTLAANKPVKLFKDQWVSPTHGQNVAEMLVELGERKLFGVWHTSGAEVLDRVTFGRRLCDRSASTRHSSSRAPWRT
jgi:dTDP-4-dehydrorhamnose reductase